MAHTGLETYRWQNRLILLFSEAEDAPQYRAQLAELEALGEGFRRRDLELITVVAGQLTSGQDLDAASLQRHYDAPEGFLFLLIGKDGGVKRRASEPVTAADLIAQIDSMPMRQREMREQND